MIVFNKKRIEEILEGHWVNEPSESWQVNNVVASYDQAREDYRHQRQSLFIAIDSDTWKSHVKENSEWNDTHATVLHASQYISGVIVKTPIPQLSESIPQFVVQDTYEALNELARNRYDISDATLITTTGTDDKGILTINALFEEIFLKTNYQIVFKKQDHVNINILTALASASEKTKYIISNANNQVLISNPEIFKTFIPDIVVISSIEDTKSQTVEDSINIYVQFLEKMFVNSKVIINSDSDGFENIYPKIEKLKLDKITYGIIPNSDVFIMRNRQLGEYSQIKAKIIGENLDFQTKLTGLDNLRYILSVLATLKILYIPLYTAVKYLKDFTINEIRQHAKVCHINNGGTYTIFDSNRKSTINNIIDDLNELYKQRINLNGKSIFIIGNIEDLNEENKKEVYHRLANEIEKSNIDLILGFGNDVYQLFDYLPKVKLVGIYASIDRLAQVAASIIENEDSLLIKGYDKSEEWHRLQEQIIKYTMYPNYSLNIENNLSSIEDYGVATFNLKTGEKVAQYGNQHVTQNQGVGNLLVIHRILNLLFSKKLHRSQTFKPDAQSLNMNNGKHAIPLEKDDEIQLDDILSVALVSNAPNVLMMLANRVLGSSENSLNMIKDMVKALGLNSNIAENITGLPIEGKKQKLTLGNLFIIGKLLFSNYPVVRDILSSSSYTFKNITYKIHSNLYDYGLITHGLFYGVNDSIGIVRSKFNGETYITTVLGARNAFHRDALIHHTLSKVFKSENEKIKIENIRKVKHDSYRINILGDIYFEEEDAISSNYDEILQAFLETQNPLYRFEKVRSLLNEGDFNICMLDAPLFDSSNSYLKQRISNVKHSNEVGTLETLKQENIDLVALASPHIMDSNIDGLNRTLELLEEHDIYNIGAGSKQKNAEKPFVIYVNHQRYMIFNAYAYDSEDYYEYERYAIGNEEGIACLNPFLYETMSIAKHEDEETKIIVIVHWGNSNQSNEDLTRQKSYIQQLSEAGADIIIGHGNYNMQGIEQINRTLVLHNIGVGVSNNNISEKIFNQFPYSFIAQLNIRYNHTISLKLYPIYQDNYQPRFVNEEEFMHCLTLLKANGTFSKIPTKKDSHYYFKIPL